MSPGAARAPGVSARDTAGTLLGRRAAMPVAVAPWRTSGCVHPDGELAAARAAARGRRPVHASTLSSCRIEEIAAAGGHDLVPALLAARRGLTRDLVRRAEDAAARAGAHGRRAVMGRRLRDLRNGFALPAGRTGGQPGRRADRRRTPRGRRRRRSRSTPRSRSARPDLVRPRPAARADDAAPGGQGNPRPRATRGGPWTMGADAVVVSNHGGRQLDGARAQRVALPPVAKRSATRCEVLLDSGVRSGTDVLRALALGRARRAARAGPLLWGLAAERRATVSPRTCCEIMRTRAGGRRDAPGAAAADLGRRPRGPRTERHRASDSARPSRSGTWLESCTARWRTRR